MQMNLAHWLAVLLVALNFWILLPFGLRSHAEHFVMLCCSFLHPFRNEFVFYGVGLLGPRPTSKLEDHPLSFVRGFLFL
jgi:hypothetical protein